MIRFRARFHLPGAALLAAGVLASACASTAPPRQSKLQQQVGKGTMSATELRMRVDEAADRLGGMLENAADQIRSKSSDPAVRRRALVWKADGIPALYAAAFRPDPLAGGFDLWVLIVQMDLHLTEGAGKAAFGNEQAIAVAAVGKMRVFVEQTAVLISGTPEQMARRRADVEAFARAHPIEAGFSDRASATAELAKFFDQQDVGTFAIVGQAGNTLEDLSLRLNSYSTLLPKEIRWQGELLAGDVTGRESLGATLDDIDEIGKFARRADAVLADVPGTVRSASGPIGELVDAQRKEILASLDLERATLTAFVTAERQAATDAIREERTAAFESLAKERAAALQEVDAISKRSVDAAAERAHGVVDYVFWRVLILLAIAGVIVLAAVRMTRAPRVTS